MSQQAISKRLNKTVQTIRENVRRKGIAAPATVLATFLTQSVADADVPASLTSNLMKIGIAGVGQTATAAGGASAVAGSLSALLSVKGVTLAVFGVPILILSTLIVMEHKNYDRKTAAKPIQALQSATAAKPAPTAPSEQEETVSAKADSENDAVSEAQYEIIWMPDGTYPDATLNTLNDGGMVAVQAGSTNVRAAGWWRPGMTAADVIDYVGEWEGTRPGAINNNGDLVGTFYQRNNHLARAFLQPRNEPNNIIILPMLGGDQIAPSDVSNKREIVGWAARELAQPRHGFHWSPETGIKDLGSLSEDGESVAIAVNETGEVVGYAVGTDKFYHAFRWTAETGMIDIGFPPKIQPAFGENVAENISHLGGKAYAINDQGEILINIAHQEVETEAEINFQGKTEMTKLSTGLRKPYIWTEAKGYTPVPCPEIYQTVTGIAINNRSEILLWCGDQHLDKKTATYVFTTGELRKLPEIEEHCTYWDINDQGWILGRCPDPDENIVRGFILKPSPNRQDEPKNQLPILTLPNGSKR